MKKYEKPTIEIVLLDLVDVMTVSGGIIDEETGPLIPLPTGQELY